MTETEAPESDTILLDIYREPTSHCSPFCTYNNRCKSPLCQHCSNYKAYRSSTNLYAHVRNIEPQRLLHIVLTSPPSSLTYKQQAKQLLASFEHLRRLNIWRTNIAGGVRKIEFTYDAVEQRQSVHLHILAELNYQQDLSADLEYQWLNSTGATAKIIAIEDDNHRKHCSNYVCKAPQIALFDHPQELRIWHKQCKGTRPLQTFGTWNKIKLSKRIVKHEKPNATIDDVPSIQDDKFPIPQKQKQKTEITVDWSEVEAFTPALQTDTNEQNSTDWFYFNIYSMDTALGCRSP